MPTRVLLEGPAIELLLARVREEYGPMARIISAEKVRIGGLGGFFAKQRYEIAIEVDEPAADRSPTNPGDGRGRPGGAARAEPTGSAERAGRSERAEWAERADRADQAGPAERPERSRITQPIDDLLALVEASQEPFRGLASLDRSRRTGAAAAALPTGPGHSAGTAPADSPAPPDSGGPATPAGGETPGDGPAADSGRPDWLDHPGVRAATAAEASTASNASTAGTPDIGTSTHPAGLTPRAGLVSTTGSAFADVLANLQEGLAERKAALATERERGVAERTHSQQTHDDPLEDTGDVRPVELRAAGPHEVPATGSVTPAMPAGFRPAILPLPAPASGAATTPAVSADPEADPGNATAPADAAAAATHPAPGVTAAADLVDTTATSHPMTDTAADITGTATTAGPAGTATAGSQPAGTARPDTLEPEAGGPRTADLIGLGLPAALAAGTTADDPYQAALEALRDLPEPPTAPSAPGDVLVIVGDLAEALPVARQAAVELHLDPTKLLLAGPSVANTGLHVSRRITGPADARRRARTMHRDDMSHVVVIDAPTRGTKEGWVEELCDALGATAVWAVVDASRKTADTARHLASMGPVDAVSVYGVAGTIDPASVLSLDAPVALLDGQPATAGAWARLLSERIQPRTPPRRARRKSGGNRVAD